MDLRLLRPGQIRDAIRAGTPLLVPAGCVECHGAHSPVGVDTLVVTALCQAVAARVPAVVAPVVDYGPTGYAVSGPEWGTVDISGPAFSAYVKGVLGGLMRMGWPRLVVIVHHQGMAGPEALAFRQAASELAFELTLAEKGPGWWGEQPPETHGNVWVRARVAPSVLPAAESLCRGDHAGGFETSLMLHLHPETVDMTELDRHHFWYTDRPDNLARAATREQGQRCFQAMVDAWVVDLYPGG